MSSEHNPEKETVLVHHLSPELERELILRAQTRHHDAGAEASEIIERHVDEESSGII